MEMVKTNCYVMGAYCSAPSCTYVMCFDSPSLTWCDERWSIKGVGHCGRESSTLGALGPLTLSRLVCPVMRVVWIFDPYDKSNVQITLELKK